MLNSFLNLFVGVYLFAHMFGMPEKSLNSHSWIFRPSPAIHWSFKVLMFAVFLGIVIIWGIDGWDVSNFHKDFLVVKFNTSSADNLTETHQDLSSYGVSLQSNSTFPGEVFQENLTHTHQNFTQAHESLPLKPINVTLNELNVTENPRNRGALEWVSAELEDNYSSNLLAGWLTPGGEPCKDSQTVDISIPGLDSHARIELSTGEIHEFVIQALDDSGKPHCLGGDYFEIDLSGESWKSRPPIRDLGNGTYIFSVQVHPDFPGNYNLNVTLLFRHYQGLKFSPERFALDKLLRSIPIKFKKSAAQLPEIPQCKKSDFTRDVWSGRWTRHGKNDSCLISNDGRYRCLEPNFPCVHPWCDGSLGVIESNGWVYSTHCSFKVFSAEAAWECLNNRWIFFWGDSNHCDTIRNILNFILNVDMKAVPRLFDMNITNPNNPVQSVRITSIFNGHYNDTGNYQGLNSLKNEAYREKLKVHFSGEIVPDTVIMNSGLHDGVFWTNLRKFTKGAVDAAAFWAEVMDGVRQRGLVVPEIIYRSTVATGGYARRLVFNPHKMEAFNGVFLDKLKQFKVVNLVIDHFDMTYPWHYDNRCNDGVHYGRAPAKMKWRDGEIGHQYFVDLMLGHVLLNALCTR